MTSLPPLLIAVPLLAACVLLAGSRLLPRLAVDLLSTLAATIALVIAGFLVVATKDERVVSWAGGWRRIGIALSVDPTSAWLACLICFLGACALLYGWRYFEEVRAHYHALLLLFLAGMLGFAITGDLFDMFVFFELMGATAYALTGFKVEEPESVQGAFSFAVVNSLGGYLCLMGIGLLYARTGALNLVALGEAVRGRPVDLLVIAAFVLVGCGWLVKAAAVPFHFWLVDAHAVAPTPVCVLFSGVMAPLGVYGLARVESTVFASVQPMAQRVFLVLGIVTAIVGAIMCVTQRHLKRLLAYSTVAHIGIFLVGLSTLDIRSTGVYLLAHAGVKGALFLLVGILLAKHCSVDEIDLHRDADRSVFRGILFAIAALALAGLPPFGTALGKSLLEDSGTGIAVLLIAVSAVTGGAVLRAGLRVHFGLGPPPESEQEVSKGEERDPEVTGRTHLTMVAAILVLLGFGLAIGILPSTAPEWTLHGVLLGLLSTALAGAVAAMSIWKHHFGRRIRPAINVLHRVHSGHVGDYAAWLMAGVAFVALLAVF
ncbi:complex I subunit 5 family protein [Fodinicola acaciae]|uniref:complex I subunit 5 family protein n=1 Tax=Fodinicola acaciae TaxID=2681555 RepID=UPI0013CFFF2D|nr:complex I subunit 5 family protein [Fodinicola acaciae]